MTKEFKGFPRSFRSSSAAYRSIYQYEDKKGLLRGESGLVMTKVDNKNFLVSLPVKITVKDFNEKLPNVTYPDGTYRYFPDGLNGVGYYELKTGERRRPNSKHITIDKVYNDFVSDVCK